MRYWLSRLFLWVLGWRVEGQNPNIPKALILVAPHTANQDFIYWLPMAYIFRHRFRYLAQEELFSKWFGWFLKLTGGVPVRRGQGMVKAAVDYINTQERVAMAISPEGALRKKDYWHTGFYQIATQADIPIVPAYIDYRKKVVGIGDVFHPSGDLEVDMAFFRGFYAPYHAKYPEKVSAVQIKPRDVQD